jgi:hypothetical protein
MTPPPPHISPHSSCCITDFRNWKVWHLSGLQWHNMHEKFHKIGQQVNGHNAHMNMCMHMELWFLKNSYLHVADTSQSSLRNSTSFTEPEVIVCIHKSPPTLTIFSQIYPPRTAAPQLHEVHFHVILLSTSKPYDKIFMHFSSLLSVLTATPISTSFTLST